MTKDTETADRLVGATRSHVLGYVPGAWDMFHVGHLRLIERAKERCDTLIVGVVTDEVLHAAKNKWPVIPFEERLRVIGAMRVVDRAVVDVSSDKLVAWRVHRFDVLFKGDDWRATEKGERLEADMASVGVDVCYLPYTTHTSSTLLRRLVDDRVSAAARTDAPSASEVPPPGQSSRNERR